MVLWALHSPALMVEGGGHTNAPSDDGGWKTQVKWNSISGEPTGGATQVGPRWLLGDKHDDRPVGSTFMQGGTNFTIVSNILSPSGTLRAFKTLTAMPTNSWYQIYTGSVAGLVVTVHGYGCPIGNPVVTHVPMMITNFCHTDASTSFDVSGLGKFVVQQSSNLVDWVQSTNVFSAPANVTMSCGGADKMFYRLVITEEVVRANGYKAAPIDGMLRSAKMLITGTDSANNWLLAQNFNPVSGADSAATWNYDSCSGVFAKINGKWYLVGVVHGGNSTELYQGLTGGNPFYGAMKDQSGLTIGGSGPDGFEPWGAFPITEGVTYPTVSQFTSVSCPADAAWLKNIIGK